MNKIYNIFFLVCIVSLRLGAQTNDTLAVKQITAWQYNEYATDKTQVAIDTMHANFYDCMPNARLSNFELDLASFGSPAFSLQYAPMNTTPFFYHAFESSSIAPNTMLVYNAPRPYTELFYSGAQFQQQQVRVLHTQNYSKDLNVGAVLHYYKTAGEYTPQGFAGKHIAPWVAYNGQRFSTYFKYSFNSYEFDANGGILADSLITQTNFIMSLQKASTKITNTNVMSMMKWNISKKPVYRDSSSIAIRSYPAAVGYQLKHTAYSHMYTHTSLPSNWYIKTLWDTLNTYDTTIVSQTENTLFLELFGANSFIDRKTVFAAGYQYNHASMRNYNYSYPSEYANSMYINGDFDVTILPIDLQILYTNTYYVWGDYRGDNISKTCVSKDITLGDHRIEFQFLYENSNTTPRSLYDRYLSNHYMWDNDFAKQSIQKVTYRTNFTKYNILIEYSNYYLQNYMYFNTKGTLLQATEPARAFVGTIQKTTELWKFRLTNSLLLQAHTTSGVDYPMWATYNAIAFGDVFYKKLIHTYIGLEGLYYPSYYTPQYNTSLNVFTQQFDTKLGDFPQINAFISIKYKPIRFMVSYTGLYAALYGKNFTALHYPQQSGYLSFAVSWLFYN